MSFGASCLASFKISLLHSRQNVTLATSLQNPESYFKSLMKVALSKGAALCRVAWSRGTLLLSVLSGRKSSLGITNQALKISRPFLPWATFSSPRPGSSVDNNIIFYHRVAIKKNSLTFVGKSVIRGESIIEKAVGNSLNISIRDTLQCI